MAVPELTFIWISALAAIMSIPALLDIDRGTRILSSVIAMVFWGVWAFSAYEVDAGGQTYSFAPLVYVGYALAAVMLVFALAQAYNAIRSEIDDA
ncbi:hypothetical protein [Halobacterium hubeiense]|uniref:hypothetical protein n=1 Tax=Halobacterium hubeiense TaxID=1407499 RepID=UPI003C736AFF